MAIFHRVFSISLIIYSGGRPIVGDGNWGRERSGLHSAKIRNTFARSSHLPSASLFFSIIADNRPAKQVTVVTVY